MKKALLTTFCSLFIAPAFAQTGIANPLMHKADSLITSFMTTWQIPGATVAITKDGKLVYSRGFGFADQAKMEATKPNTLFRIASNSKAITAIAILKLIENGQLSITDTVFGAGKILTAPYYLNAITDTRINKITVQQLLEHTSGWDRDQPCDGYSSCDPISFPLHVTSVMGEGNPVGDSTLIKFLLSKGLNNAPGTHYAYSNIGYLVLGKIIEKKTGMKYEDYVSSIIMQPLGLCDMHLGKNLLANKMEREGEYNNIYTTLSCYGTNAQVPWQYGGWNLEAMNAHGGWVSSSEDYVRMILAVDGYNTVPDILNAASIATMTTPSSVNANYAKGWSVNSFGNWWHTGSLDGTTTFMARTSGGYTWAFHFNYRDNSNAFATSLDQLPWSCLAATTTFPAYDLFSPGQQAANITASKSGTTSATVSWTPGNGDHSIVLATEGSTWSDFPAAGTVLTANAAYGSGQSLNATTYVVYKGNGSSFVVTGLNPSKTYHFTVLAAANSATTGNNEIYKYGCHQTVAVDMSSTGVANNGLSRGIAVYPNPASNYFNLDNKNPELYGSTVFITDIAGQVVDQVILSKSGHQTLHTGTWATGIYLLHFTNGATLKLVKGM